MVQFQKTGREPKNPLEEVPTGYMQIKVKPQRTKAGQQIAPKSEIVINQLVQEIVLQGMLLEIRHEQKALIHAKFTDTIITTGGTRPTKIIGVPAKSGQIITGLVICFTTKMILIFIKNISTIDTNTGTEAGNVIAGTIKAGETIIMAITHIHTGGINTITTTPGGAM